MIVYTCDKCGKNILSEKVHKLIYVNPQQIKTVYHYHKECLPELKSFKEVKEALKKGNRSLKDIDVARIMAAFYLCKGNISEVSRRTEKSILTCKKYSEENFSEEVNFRWQQLGNNDTLIMDGKKVPIRNCINLFISGWELEKVVEETTLETVEDLKSKLMPFIGVEF